MRIFKGILFSVFLLCTASLSGFNYDTDTTKNSESTLTKFYTLHQFEFADSVNSIDNSLYDFQKYISKNTLGNTGLAFHPLNYSPLPAQTGFRYYRNHYEGYYYLPQNLNFYNSRTPYTDLFYVIGTKKEQLFRMTFSYNVKKNWNITANLFRIRSDGTYTRQNTNDNFIAVSTNFKSETNRYWLAAGIIYNAVNNSENGGMVNDSVFDGTSGVDETLLNVNLSNARKKVINRDVFVKQIFNLGRRSTDTTNSRWIIPSSRFILTSSFDDNYINYKDEYNDLISGYYSNIYYDTLETFDSTYYSKIENELEWKRTDNLRHRGMQDMLGIRFSVKHQLIHVRQKEIDSVYNNIIAGASLYNTYSKNSFWWNLSGTYAATGYNEGDYSAVLALRKGLADSLVDVSLSATAKTQSPDFIYNQWRSNNLYWSNNFDNSEQVGAELSFRMKKYDLELNAGIDNYKNVLYFDNFAIARQYKGSVPVMHARLKKDFSLYNWHLNNTVTYQYVPDSTVIRLPQFTLEHSLYYENNIKDILRLQIGASVYFVSNYYANAYMPVTGQFYLQNERKYGNYPFIDVFLNARIKAVRIFIKVDHLNKGWTGANYILTPGNPYAGRTFKFGVSWKFYD